MEIILVFTIIACWFYWLIVGINYFFMWLHKRNTDNEKRLTYIKKYGIFVNEETNEGEMVYKSTKKETTDDSGN